MLESLIGSRIRRTLLEYLVHNPDSRFYLRGLAKELGLTVSPVRRELKRLERLGLLKAYQEANVRFYIVDQTNPIFLQLNQAAQPIDFPGQQPSLGPVVSSTVISHPKIERIRQASTPKFLVWGQALRPRLSWPVLAGALSLSLVVVLVLGTVTYFAVTNHRLLSLLPAPMNTGQAGTNQAVSTPRSQVTVVESEPKTSGEMRGTRWRLLPGSIGGFSPAITEESY